MCSQIRDGLSAHRCRELECIGLAVPTVYSQQPYQFSIQRVYVKL